MATHTGPCGELDVVQATFNPQADITVHIENKGGCAVTIHIWRGNEETDRKTVRPPRIGGAITAADLEGDGADRITFSCGAGAPDGQCLFDYVIGQRP